MYVGTQFNWVDKSAITKVSNVEINNAPLYAATFSCDMGPEEWTLFDSKNFFELCGSNISFSKHGQPLVQVANMINNGARVLGKRIVATDSKLANIALVAEVCKLTREKTNEAGEKLYIQEDGSEGTVITDTPAVETYANVTWTAHSASSAGSMTEVENLQEDVTLHDVNGTVKTVNEQEVTVYSFPLFLFADNGRGVSTKKVRFYGDYDLSKGLDFMMYYAYVMEGTRDLEGVRFTGDPTIVYSGSNLGFENQGKKYTQCKVVANEEIMEEFINRLALCAGVEADELRTVDFLFGKTRKGKALNYITIDTENGLDLTSPLGINFMNGDDGSFTNKAFGTEMYATESIKAWDGTFSDEIWDRDTYKIAAIFDANYPSTVKKAIENFVIWREDTMFFEDQGIGLSSYEQISIAAENVADSKFIAAYLTTYEIVDPFTKKQIRVTLPYSLSVLMIDDFASESVHYAQAGIANGYVITEAIEGTINFTPKITPSVNQKELLEEIKVNYATYIEGQLVIESLYTHQSDFTQLSFVNNVLAIEEVARAIRTKCPSIRYSFITGDGLAIYKDAIEHLLENYKEHFQSLEFVYVSDPVMESNKIFKAALQFRFNNFAQSEIFDLIALPTE